MELARINPLLPSACDRSHTQAQLTTGLGVNSILCSPPWLVRDMVIFTGQRYLVTDNLRQFL